MLKTWQPYLLANVDLQRIKKLWVAWVLHNKANLQELLQYQTDAGVAGEEVGLWMLRKQKRGFMEDRQAIGTEYEPWIETDIIRKEGSLGGIAKSMKDLMESGD